MATAAACLTRTVDACLDGKDPSEANYESMSLTMTSIEADSYALASGVSHLKGHYTYHCVLDAMLTDDLGDGSS